MFSPPQGERASDPRDHPHAVAARAQPDRARPQRGEPALDWRDRLPGGQEDRRRLPPGGQLEVRAAYACNAIRMCASELGCVQGMQISVRLNVTSVVETYLTFNIILKKLFRELLRRVLHIIYFFNLFHLSVPQKIKFA